MMNLTGKNFFWFSAGSAMLLLAVYGVFSGRIQEFFVNLKSGELKFTMAPIANKNSVAASTGDGGFHIMVPGLGTVTPNKNDLFMLAIVEGEAITRNSSIIRSAIDEDRTGVKYQQTDSNGIFSVWTTADNFNEKGEHCVDLTSWYQKYSGPNEWGFLRACKAGNDWNITIDPDLVELMSGH